MARSGLRRWRGFDAIGFVSSSTRSSPDPTAVYSPGGPIDSLSGRSLDLRRQRRGPPSSGGPSVTRTPTSGMSRQLSPPELWAPLDRAESTPHGAAARVPLVEPKRSPPRRSCGYDEKAEVSQLAKRLDRLALRSRFTLNRPRPRSRDFGSLADPNRSRKPCSSLGVSTTHAASLIAQVQAISGFDRASAFRLR